MSTRLPVMTLPRRIRSSIASAVRMSRSAGAPASTASTISLVESKLTLIFASWARSNSGASSIIASLMPLVHWTVISVATVLLPDAVWPVSWSSA